MAFGIFEGPSTQEGTQYNNISGLSSTVGNMGLQDLGESQGFMQAILSGDPTKIGQVLSPQIKAIQGQGQQSKQTAGQFGNRGGGTNAANETIDDKTRGSINDLISSLTSSAVSGLNNTGLALTGQAQSGFGTAFNQAKTMQTQKADMITDLLKSIGDTATGFATGFGG